MLKNQMVRCTLNTVTVTILYLLSLLLQMAEGMCWSKLGLSNVGTQTKLTVFLSASFFILLVYKYLTDFRFVGRSKVLVFIGVCSFGIYLSHMLVIGILEKIPINNKIPFGVNSTLVVLVCCACVLIGKKICGPKISDLLGLNWQIQLHYLMMCHCIYYAVTHFFIRLLHTLENRTNTDWIYGFFSSIWLFFNASIDESPK